jgi:hypothetical protein
MGPGRRRTRPSRNEFETGTRFAIIEMSSKEKKEDQQ